MKPPNILVVFLKIIIIFLDVAIKMKSSDVE